MGSRAIPAQEHTLPQCRDLPRYVPSGIPGNAVISGCEQLGRPRVVHLGGPDRSVFFHDPRRTGTHSHPIHILVRYSKSRRNVEICTIDH
jgi:hypothetical protein